MLSLLFFFFFSKLCAILCLFMYDTNYVYKCNPTSIQYFLNTPGRHYSLRVKSWKPCELQKVTRVTRSALSWIQLERGLLVTTMYWNSHPKNTHFEKYFLRQGALGSSSPSWCEESPQEHRERERGAGRCNSTILSLALYSGPRQSTCPVASYVTCPKT